MPSECFLKVVCSSHRVTPSHSSGGPRVGGTCVPSALKLTCDLQLSQQLLTSLNNTITFNLDLPAKDNYSRLSEAYLNTALTLCV